MVKAGAFLTDICGIKPLGVGIPCPRYTHNFGAYRRTQVAGAGPNAAKIEGKEDYSIRLLLMPK